MVRVHDGDTAEPPGPNWKFISSDDRGDAAMKHQDRRNYVCLSLETFSGRGGKGGRLHQLRFGREATAFGVSKMSVLSYQCPNTSKDVTTSIDTDSQTLARLRDLKISVACPHCIGGHMVAANQLHFRRVPWPTASIDVRTPIGAQVGAKHAALGADHPAT